MAVERGPLVYSLKLGETWTRVNADKPHRELPHGDFEVRPTTPWNYGLLVDEAKPRDEHHVRGAARGRETVLARRRGRGRQGEGPEAAGLEAGARLGRGDPARPAGSAEPLEDLTLIPYGCTNIRVTEFPRFEGVNARA